jgi:hypothetical protein
LTSCESEDDTNINDSEFRLEFSDSTLIKETDISYYDSSTCILFLNKDLNLKVGEGRPPTSCTQFTVYVNNEIIYQGGVYPNYEFNSIPLNPIFISSMTYPILNNSILPIHGFKKIINDPRIIMSLENSNLLYKGISGTIDNIMISPDDDKILNITITLYNHDKINYYIPDPLKNKTPPFIIDLSNLETKEYLYIADSQFKPEWNFTLDDLSLLKKEITYTYSVSCNQTIKTGLYDCYLRIDNVPYFLSTSIPLILDNGNIWVGRCYSPIKRIMIE